MKTKFSPKSNDNTLFVTNQCNNKCLMCVQPPTNTRDIDFHFERNKLIIDSSPIDIETIGITGGEPTLMKDKLYLLIQYIRNKYPTCLIHILSNGRAYSQREEAKKLSNFTNTLIGIPLHSDNYIDHDLIANTKDAYNETLKGLYNLGYYGIDIELRIVINKLNFDRLSKISNFIWRNLPFVKHVAFIGMEDIGYTIKNHDKVWIDPYEYKNNLTEAVLSLSSWNIDTSIFNIPHCLLHPQVHEYARKSISDWKIMFQTECNECMVMTDCCGLFSTSKQQSPYIKKIQ